MHEDAYFEYRFSKMYTGPAPGAWGTPLVPYPPVRLKIMFKGLCADLQFLKYLYLYTPGYCEELGLEFRRRSFRSTKIYGRFSYTMYLV